MCNTGYFLFSVTKDRRARKFGQHRLMAMAFIPNPQNKPEVNHIDGVKTNNILSNLEWVTRTEQRLHQYRVLKKGCGTSAKTQS